MPVMVCRNIKEKEGENRMNKVIISGRLTADPVVRYGEDGQVSMVRYTLAVHRQGRRNAEDDKAYFIDCCAFGKGAQFAAKYLRKGVKIILSGRLGSGSYEGKDGRKVYFTNVIAETQEFAESRSVSEKDPDKNSLERNQTDWEEGQRGGYSRRRSADDEFARIAKEIDDQLPFR